MHETIKHPSGDEAGTAAGKKMPEGRRFSGDYAREMGRRRAQKRLEKAGGRTQRGHVTLPADQAPVFEAIRDQAKTGNPQAVREYREWLVKLPMQYGSETEDWQAKTLEEMTPEELDFAEAWALRQIARAQRKLQGIRGTFALDHTAAQGDEAAPPK